MIGINGAGSRMSYCHCELLRLLSERFGGTVISIGCCNKINVTCISSCSPLPEPNDSPLDICAFCTVPASFTRPESTLVRCTSKYGKTWRFGGSRSLENELPGSACFVVSWLL
jgi:hypothetical protein